MGSVVLQVVPLVVLVGCLLAMLVATVRSHHRKSLAAAEDRTRQLQLRLSGVLSIATEAIISVDNLHRITMFNTGAERLFGYAASDVLGRPLAMLLPDRFRERHSAHMRQFAEAGAGARQMGERTAIFARRRDGQEFRAEAAISTLHDASGRVFTVVLRDVTARVEAAREIEAINHQLEEKVAERTAELTAVLDAVPDGLVTIDLEGHLSRANATLARLTGYDLSAFPGMTIATLLATKRDAVDVAAAWTGWETGARSAPVAVRCRRKDGTTFPAFVLGNVVRHRDNRIVGRVCIIRDQTEQLRRQQELQHAQKMEAIGQLSGGIAHDFNNLLTMISGNQELLEMRLTDPKQLTLLKRAQEATAMGARLTDRLLTFARRRQLEPTELNLNNHVTDMIELLHRAIGEHVTLGTDLEPRLWPVRVDASGIEGAILNLAINARDAMPDGGRIIIETANVVLTETDQPAGVDLPPGDYVRVAMSDTGTGMPADVRQRAFEPFFTTKQPGKGTGLGLSTIYGFARQSGGTATLVSEMGQGTTVTILLPRLKSEPVAISRGPSAERSQVGRGERILLVEDSTEVRQVTRPRLEALGYQVQEAASGVDAIAFLQTGSDAVDAVLSDVVMPGGASGYDVAKHVATHSPRIRVLLTSGYADEAARVHDVSVPKPRLLRKPYSSSELARALRDVIDG